MNFLVLSSSRGTTFQAVLDAMMDGSLTMPCLGLVADRGDRGCVEKAHNNNVRVSIVERTKGEERTAYDQRLHDALIALGAKPEETIIAALGWMWILSPEFVKQWKILNVHPALLPKYPGSHAIEDALADGATQTGMTIHWIDEGVDTGPIVLQKSCPIDEGETIESLKEKIQALEKEWYPICLDMIQAGKLIMNNE